MTTLRTDPTPGITPADGSLICTDQHNEIVSRIGGANRLTASKFVMTDSSGFLTTSTDLPLAAGSLTTTSYSISENTDEEMGTEAIAIVPTAANKNGNLSLRPSGTAGLANIILYSQNDRTNADVAYIQMFDGDAFYLGTDFQGTGVSRNIVIQPGAPAFIFGTDGSLTLPGTLVFSANKAITAASGAGAPSTSNVPASQFMVWKDTDGGSVKLYYNDAGSLKSVTLT